jgi:hypothetical protein
MWTPSAPQLDLIHGGGAIAGVGGQYLGDLGGDLRVGMSSELLRREEAPTISPIKKTSRRLNDSLMGCV